MIQNEERLSQLKKLVEDLPYDLKCIIMNLVTTGLVDQIRVSHHIFTQSLVNHRNRSSVSNERLEQQRKIWKIFAYFGDESFVSFSKFIRDSTYQTIERYAINLENEEFNYLINSFFNLETAILEFIQCVDTNRANFTGEHIHELILD